MVLEYPRVDENSINMLFTGVEYGITRARR